MKLVLDQMLLYWQPKKFNQAWVDNIVDPMLVLEGNLKQLIVHYSEYTAEECQNSINQIWNSWHQFLFEDYILNKIFDKTTFYQ